MNLLQLSPEPPPLRPVNASLCEETALDVSKTKDSVTQTEPSAEVERLLAILEQDTRKRRKWNAILFPLYGGFLAIFVALLVVGRISGHRFVHVSDFYYIGAVNVIGGLLGAFTLNKKAAAQITKLEDVRCISALMDIWQPQGDINYRQNTREEARRAVVRLLPHLQAGDAPLLKEAQRAVLRHVLHQTGKASKVDSNQIEFTVAIIKAFEQIGDWKSLPQVRTLAEPALPHPIRAAARKCLPHLEMLAQKHQPGETLLRASSVADAAQAAPEMLLRPAASTSDKQPETLLRPVK